MKFFAENIRTRLTVKYIGVFALLLFGYGIVTTVFLYYYLSHELDLNLKEDLEIIEELLITSDIVLNPPVKQRDHVAKRYERFVEIWNDSSTLLYRSSAFDDTVKFPQPSIKHYSDEPQYFSVTLPNGQQWRMIGVKLRLHEQPHIVRVSMSGDHIADQMREFFVFMSFLAPFFLLIGAISGYILARQALAPIDRMVIQAKKIGTENLKERLPVINPNDELGNLATVTNELLDRIQFSFEQLKNFTSDASHELRTPLTVMRSVGEVGLQSAHTIDDLREVVGSMLEENSRLTRLVDCLLLLSRADSGRIQLNKEQFDLYRFTNETTEVITVLAEEKEQTLSVQGESGIIVNADKTLLRQALLNLLDNAIKYTPPKGTIVVTVSQTSQRHSCIEVKDSGPGISQDHHGKVFDRFYRIDRDRSRETGGAGLGLAIVQWVMSIHHGTVTLQSSSSGSMFTLELPVVQVPLSVKTI